MINNPDLVIYLKQDKSITILKEFSLKIKNGLDVATWQEKDCATELLLIQANKILTFPSVLKKFQFCYVVCTGYRKSKINIVSPLKILKFS